MANQSRILLILKYLYNSTDAAHDVSSKDIARMLESNGITSHDRRTIETDIDMLISAGHDICKVHRANLLWLAIPIFGTDEAN